MQDLQGRSIRYLRLSITEACAMRCLYCRPAAMPETRSAAPLTPAEIEQLVRHLIVRHGLRKVRLTGGEPTSRPDLLEIIDRLAALPLLDIGLTTNGLTLARDAVRLRQAGLTRINVSLDSLEPERFAHITGSHALPRVLAGIAAAVVAGFSPIKLNCVVVRGSNFDELPALVAFAAQHGCEIRFIELMPMGPLANQWHQLYVPEQEMRQQLASTISNWTPLPHHGDSARRYRGILHTGDAITVGFITAMSCPFCSACDRIRIAADGAFYPCLMDRPAANLMPALRPALNPELLDDLLFSGVAGKAEVHPAIGFSPMIQIGG